MRQISSFFRILILYCVAALSLPSGTAGQDRSVYFVDGFHGGVYGHYPIMTYTKFMSDQLDQHPEWKICLEIEPETWDTVSVRTPEEFRRFAEKTKTDRVEYTNPNYAQPYLYNISGESIIRQFKYGIRKLHEHFPWMTFTTYAVEEPCFTSCLPMILNQFGFKYAVIKCPDTCWGGYPSAFGGELVNWIGPDGSRILSSPRSACEKLEENSVWQTQSWRYNPEYIEACFEYGIKHPVGMCYQDAGWTNGPWVGTDGPSIYVTWTEYFEKIADWSLAEDWHFSQENIHPGLMWGTQALQRLARGVRETENRLAQTEKMSVIAALEGQYTPDFQMIDEAWRTLLLSQHHDCWIIPLARMQGRRTWAENVKDWTDASIKIANDIDEASAASYGRTGTKNFVYARVFNTVASDRNEVIEVTLPESFRGWGTEVKDAAGKTVDSRRTDAGVSFIAGVPSFGYSTYSIRRIKEKDTDEIDSGETDVIENSMYRISFDRNKGGVISSLVMKDKDEYEYSNPESGFSIGEIRGYFYNEGKFISSADKPADIVIDRSVAGIQKAVIKGMIGETPFTETITLKEGDRKIDISLMIDWQENHGIGKRAEGDVSRVNERAFYNTMYMLNYLVPTSLVNPNLSKDASFDVCESRIDDTEFDTWDNIKHNVILNWVYLHDSVSGRGIAVFSDHTTSYSFSPTNPFGITVQFSGSGLWNPNYDISGPTEVRFCLVPHEGCWDKAGINEENLLWREPLKTVVYEGVEFADKSLIGIDGSGYEISAAYMTDEGMLLRLYNSSSDESVHTLRFGAKISSISELDLNEKPIRNVTVVEDCSMKVSMPRFGIKTYMIKTK